MDTAYYSNEDPGTGGDPNASSDSSGVGGGGPGDSSSADFRLGIGLGGGDNFNAPGDITGMGFGGVGQGPGGPPGGFGGGYYRNTGGGGGGGGYYRTGGGGGGGGYYGGAGGFGGLGLGTDLGSLAQNAGFGFGPSAGNPAGVGPDPSIVGSTADAPAIQSARQLADPGLLTQGANDPNAAQPSAPGGAGSGPQMSMLDQALSILGGINPVGAASAAEAPPGTAGQGGLPSTPVTPGGADVGFVDPNLSGAPPSGYLSGAGSNIPGMFAGGGIVPSGLGGVSGGNIPGLSDNAAPPSGFLGDTGSGIPGMFAGGGMVGGSTGAPVTAQGVGGVASDQSTNFAGQFAPAEGMPGAVSPLAAFSGTQFGPTPLSVFANQFAPAESMPGAVSPLQAFTGTPIGPGATQQAAAPSSAVPPTDTAANLALQGVDSPPPGGPLAGGTGGGPFGPDALGAPPGRFGPNDSGFRLAGTTADTATPPAPDSPADFATRYAAAPDQQAVSPLQAFTGTRIGPSPGDPFASQFAPAEPALAANQQSFGPQTQVGNVPTPRAAPGQAAAPSAAPGGGGGSATTGAAPQQAGGGAPAGGAGGGAPSGGAGDQQRGGFERGQRRTIGQQVFGQGGMVSSLFGGGQLGDTVASLMAQLGIPAALIFAATRGGGARLPMVGGARAMSGAGQVGGFSPQFSRQLFPGPGIPALVGLGLGGAALGQRLAQGDQTAPDQGAGPPSRGASETIPPPPPQTRPTLPTATTGPVATTPADLTGGARPGATQARPAPFGAEQAPQGAMVGANFEPGMLSPITQPGGGTQAENFITQRGGHTAGAGAPQLNPEFASRVQRAAQAYEAETGRPATFGETGRSHERQAQYYADFRAGRGGRAAPPGYGRHEKGLAIDIDEPRFQAWMHRNAWKFGLEGLAPSLNDPNHFQMASPVLAGIRQRQAMAQ